MTCRSFHAAATWTFSEGDRSLRRVRCREPPEGIFLRSGAGQKCVSPPVADDTESLSADGHKTAAPPSRPAAATDAVPISGPPAHGHAFAVLPAGYGLIAGSLGIPEPKNRPTFARAIPRKSLCSRRFFARAGG